MKKGLALAFVIFALSLAAGCGGRPEGLPDLYPVTITVQCDGRPVPGVSVMAIPAEKLNFVFAANTDESGVAKIGASHAGKFYAGLPLGTMNLNIDKGITIGSGDEAHMVKMIAEASPTTLEVTKSGAELTIDIVAVEDFQDHIYEALPQIENE
ncbi:MAG: hypothetical protein J6S75_09315 [Thermoguttaceae bacterium]|nr:hypothetical protein [Thermoguttaceae bacterium]